MYAGMLVDTNNFRQRVGVRTFTSAAKLKEMSANVVEAYELLEDSFDKIKEIKEITSSAYKYSDNILITCANENKEYTTVTLAKASNSLLNIKNIKAAFTIGRISKNRIAISARSTRNINVQMIMEELGGGGHFTMAACQIEKESISEVREMLEDAIKNYFENRSE